MNPKQIYFTDSLIIGEENIQGKNLLEVITILKNNSGGGSSVFAEDLNVSPGVTLGAYGPNETIPTEGLTPEEVFQLIVTNYVSPVFSSFNVTGQNTTVEVGTTLSGSKTFTWGISNNSGTVSIIDIYDNTDDSALATSLSNDGSQSVTINTIQLNSNGATQSWKAIGYDASNEDTSFNSNNFVVIGRFYRFTGPTSSLPTNSSEVRALPNSTFYTGSGSFTLATGNSETNFIVALPPGVTITSVTDQSALNADITSEYILTGTINVQDAGGTNRTYNLYQMTIAVPYISSHNHLITIS